MEMLNAFIYFWSILLGSGLNILTNTSLSSLNSSELASYLIAEQKHICPNISLCHTPNSSVFQWDVNRYFPPCCKECSCEATCVKDASSCPVDATEDSVAIKEQTRDGTEIPDYDNVGRTETYRLECVKEQHGHIENKNGYMMVASCPTKFDDVEVKRKCEVKFTIRCSFQHS
jgi:hypothetical protein